MGNNFSTEKDSKINNLKDIEIISDEIRKNYGRNYTQNGSHSLNFNDKKKKNKETDALAEADAKAKAAVEIKNKNEKDFDNKIFKYIFSSTKKIKYVNKSSTDLCKILKKDSLYKINDKKELSIQENKISGFFK